MELLHIKYKVLTQKELLKHARTEWSVESMHWLIDVCFGEDDCRVQDKKIKRVLNIIRKIAINFLHIFHYKINPKRPFYNIMLDCLIDSTFILDIYSRQN